MKEELKSIVDWLNKHYNQDSEDYNIFLGAKPGVVRFNDHTAISLWACGAIVCIYDKIYFIQEDDGYWWYNDEEDKEYYGRYAYQDGFSIAWAESFSGALTELKKYVWEHGCPVYFSGTEVVCHYCLEDKKEESQN